MTATIVYCGQVGGDRAALVGNNVCGDRKHIRDIKYLSVKITESVETVLQKLTCLNHRSTVSCFPLIPL